MHATGGAALRGREGDFRPTVFLNYPAVDDLIARAGPPRNGRETFEPSTLGELSPRLNTRLNTVEYAYDSGRGTRVREIMLVRSIIPRQTPLDKQQSVRKRAWLNLSSTRLLRSTDMLNFFLEYITKHNKHSITNDRL